MYGIKKQNGCIYVDLKELNKYKYFSSKLYYEDGSADSLFSFIYDVKLKDGAIVFETYSLLFDRLDTEKIYINEISFDERYNSEEYIYLRCENEEFSYTGYIYLYKEPTMELICDDLGDSLIEGFLSKYVNIKSFKKMVDDFIEKPISEEYLMYIDILKNEDDYMEDRDYIISSWKG